MKDLERRVDVDKELFLSLIPMYGDVKFWHLTEGTDLSSFGKLAARTAWSSRYVGIYVMASMAYDIVNFLS